MRLIFICILFLNLLIISKCDVYVPWREQVTVYSCGDASFQMTYLSHFPNSTLSQYEIIDTARTTNTSGTWVVDLQRIAHFSNVSSAPKIQSYPFPNDVPKNGWNEVNYLGMGGFVRRAKQCWFGDLVKVIKQGFPLIVLNWFSETQHDGHFRVAFGYDDVTKELLLNDPWGRQGQPHVLRVNETVFCVLWSHFEKLYNYSYDPYTAILVSPWEVKAKTFRSNGRIFINSTIQYNAPYPFSIDADFYIAKNSVAVLSVSQRNSTRQVSQSFQNPIGLVSPNKVYEANFNIVDTGDIVELEIVAYGTVYGSLPQVPGWINGTNYPGYSYSDNIGGRLTIKI